MSMEITQDDMDNIVPRLKRALKRSHNLMGLDLWGNIRKNAPVDHGRLAGSFTLQEGSGLTSTIGSTVEYALVQEEGSDPYEIYPRAATALHFQASGGEIFAKSVSHPGVAGTHYIEGSIAQTNSRLSEFVQQALDEKGVT